MMVSNTQSSFPPSPPQTDVTFLSDELAPIALEGKLTKERGTWGAILCHPHPLHGGTMYNKVIDTAMRAVASAGGSALRFNFRGVGHSEGDYGEGFAEVADLRGAIKFLKELHPSLFPLWLIGFSFGTRVISFHLADSGEGDGAILIAPPVGHLGVSHFPVPEKGVHMILGEQDEFCSEDQLCAFQEKFGSSEVTASVVPNTGHFFHGHLPTLAAWVKRVVSGEVNHQGLGSV